MLNVSCSTPKLSLSPRIHAMCKLSCRAIVRAAPGSVRPVSAGKALGVCRVHAGVEIGSGEGNHVNVADLKSPLSEKLRGWKEARSEKQMTRSKFFDKLPDGGVLQGVRVVLVSPKFSANVGSAARLCANFECNDLWVVDPRCDPVGPDAQALAVGSPALSNITVVNSMTEAIQDCTVSVGFTRRKGAVRHVHASMNRLLDKHPDYLETETHGKVALVFGREDHGLELEELMACSQLCAIPTGRVQPSLNLSHSAGIALANCFERRLEGGAPIDSDMPEAHPSHEPHAAPQGWPPATTSEVNRLVERWTSAAAVLGLPSVEYDGGKSHYRRRRVVGHLRAIFSRAGINTQEVKSVHGLVSAILQKVPTEANGAASATVTTTEANGTDERGGHD